MIYIFNPNYIWYYLLSCIYDFIIAPSLHYYYILLHILFHNMWPPKKNYVCKRKYYCRRWSSRGNKRRASTTKWKKNKKNNYKQWTIILTTDTHQCQLRLMCQKYCHSHDWKQQRLFLRKASTFGVTSISPNAQLELLQGIADNSPKNPQDPMSFISMVSTRTSITRPQLFEPDSKWIGLDTIFYVLSDQ
jgi:hypothetical protein